MKVLIISPRWFVGDVVNYRYMFPLGLAYISAVLKKDGHEVDVLNINHYAGQADDIVRSALGRKRYDRVLTGGISTFLNQIKEVITVVRQVDPSVGVVLGGGVISSEPELIFNHLKPDHGVIGEGEKTVSELMTCLAEHGDVGQVDGLIYRDAQGMVKTTRPREPVPDIDVIPYPDFDGLEFEKYLEHMHPSDQYFYDLFDKPRTYPIICSRSCPFICTFCFHPLGNKYRQRSLDSIMDELRLNVPRYRINVISIYDELFSNDRERMLKFCEQIKEFTKTLPWECRWSCQMRVDRIDDEMLAKMKAAGCYMISYGFESYSPQVLKSMKKHISPEQIKRAVELTLKNDISIQGNFIFGDTAETRETAKATLEYWKDNVEAGIQLGFINPYPGTEIYNRLVTRGIIKDKLDFISNHIFDVFNLSEKMSDSEFGGLWFDLLKARITCRKYAQEYQLKEAGDGTVDLVAQCPHCQKKMEYKNYYVLSKLFLFVLMYCRSCRRRFYVGSRLYRVFSRILLLAVSLMPGVAYAVFKKIWSFLKKHDPRFKKSRLSGLLGKLSDDD